MKKVILLLLLLPFSIQVSGQAQTLIHVNVKDMLFDQTRNKIFAVISSLDPQYGNKLIQIDCDSKTIDTSIFIGSDPTLMDITSDNKFLYISLDGSPKIVKVDLDSFKIDLDFPIGPVGPHVDVSALAIETVPGKPNLVAVAREANNDQDVVIFDDGTLLPDSFGIYYVDITEIETDSTGTVLYGIDGDEFFRFDITPTGITTIDQYSGVVGGGYDLKMLYLHGLIYTSYGGIVNPHSTAPFIEGTFSGVNHASGMDINWSLKESYFGAFEFSEEELTFRRYDIESYTLKETQALTIEFPLTMTSPELRELLSYGDNKFVISAYESYFANDNEVYLIFIDTLNSTSIDIQDDMREEVSAYPNPIKDFVDLKLPQIGTYQISIINSVGVAVHTERLKESKSTSIDLSGVSAGIYFIKISNEEEQMIKKVLKL